MRETLETNSLWAKIISSAALGAAAMYVFDPEKGRRRRAVARDKARSLFNRSSDVVNDATRDASNRWQGARASVRRLFTRGAMPDDDVLVERVRARLGRVVLHPHAVHVTAHDGRVALEGPILAS